MEARRRAQPTGTKRPGGLTRKVPRDPERIPPEIWNQHEHRPWEPAPTAGGTRADPSRTRTLSPPAPGVLPGKPGGRVGRRRLQGAGHAEHYKNCKKARSSVGERYPDTVEVGGSIPPAPTNFIQSLEASGATAAASPAMPTYMFKRTGQTR